MKNEKSKNKKKGAKPDQKVKKGDKFTCDSCGMVIAVDDPCGCDACNLVCCGQDMSYSPC